jgi:hypothetical protein
MKSQSVFSTDKYLAGHQRSQSSLQDASLQYQLEEQKLVNQQLKEQNTKLLDSLKNMKGLVQTMFDRIENMKKFDNHE